MATPHLTEADPFDLPEWLGTVEVTWESRSGLGTGHLVHGDLLGTDEGHRLGCDLLGVDQAYPAPVADEATRSRAHQAWQHAQVMVADVDGVLVLCVPGTDFDADRAVDALSRLAKAVGASPDRYALRLRMGAEQRERGATDYS